MPIRRMDCAAPRYLGMPGWRILSEQAGRFRRVPLEPGTQDLVSGLESFAARSALVVRMEGMRDTRIVGICNEKDAMAGPFLASDCRVLDIIIQLVAVGLRVGERRSLELEGIQETAAAVSAELQLDRLLDLITESAARVFRAPATSLMLWDGTDSLVIRAAHNLSDHYRQQVKIPRSKVERRRKMDGTYAAEVIDLSREPLASSGANRGRGIASGSQRPLVVFRGTHRCVEYLQQVGFAAVSQSIRPP